jgi:hypothetical protein
MNGGQVKLFIKFQLVPSLPRDFDTRYEWFFTHVHLVSISPLVAKGFRRPPSESLIIYGFQGTFARIPDNFRKTTEAEETKNAETLSL